MLPAARAEPGSAGPLVALFTATSAVCVTGLIVVDTPVYWSSFGQGVIMVLFQVGGFGIMTGATLLTVLVARRLGLSDRLVARVETRHGIGEIRVVVLRIAATVLVCEGILTLILTGRFWAGYHYPFGDALWHGAFQAVSAFNNAGFSTFSNSLVGFVTDWWINLPVMVAIVIGGLGFPVLFELLRRGRRPRAWSIHTRLTVFGSAALLLAGLAATLALEWANPATLGPLGVAEKALAAAFHSVSSRTTGFNSLDTSQLHTQSWAVTDILMFIGGGSAGTAGGIKVTTFFLLGFVVWSEIRGERDVLVGRRRVSSATVRQALTVALLGAALVTVATVSLQMLTDHPLDQLLFECVSAFATVGLSTGITADLPAAGQLILAVLMFVGRVGTITVASALALRASHRRYRFPEERPIVG
ncbi:MAG: TrkH family potassium uptake protein [Micromonosporaceae bacterium]|nr:TrkH family potassium uptake protein [Micromonosporaceae bacterium]